METKDHDCDSNEFPTSIKNLVSVSMEGTFQTGDLSSNSGSVSTQVRHLSITNGDQTQIRDSGFVSMGTSTQMREQNSHSVAGVSQVKETSCVGVFLSKDASK